MSQSNIVTTGNQAEADADCTPELDDVISRIRHHGMVAGLITNGYLLVPERIERLNRAGLEWLQISIDNVTPDEVSKKSLKVLDKKLELLAEHADFHVNINSVVGGGIHTPKDALVVAVVQGTKLHSRHSLLKKLVEKQRVTEGRARRGMHRS
jgi:molybdenum cofactor biosynthesis enzyme MoaA